MIALFAILTVLSALALLLLTERLAFKIDNIDPKFKPYDFLIAVCTTLLFSFSYTLGVSVCKSETDTIKDYNKGLYQEKITYESIDGNIIPQDTTYVFKYK